MLIILVCVLCCFNLFVEFTSQHGLTKKQLHNLKSGTYNISGIGVENSGVNKYFSNWNTRGLSFFETLPQEIYSEFQCAELKMHECRWHCKHIDADEAECEDPWPPADSLNCFCYKNLVLIDGKVLHLNLTEDLYLDPEKLALALS